MTPERCVVIEDAPAGISAGRAGGMRVVAVATTHAPTELGKASVIARRLTDIRIQTRRQGGLTIRIGHDSR